MATISIGLPTQEEARELYDDAGWSAYTTDPGTLFAALRGSHLVVCARDDSGALLGLARTVSDGWTIVYLQDILVRRDSRRRGLGRALFARIVAEYPRVRQLVLLTDDEPAQRSFYESLGLTEAHDVAPHPLRAFVRA